MSPSSGVRVIPNEKKNFCDNENGDHHRENLGKVTIFSFRTKQKNRQKRWPWFFRNILRSSRKGSYGILVMAGCDVKGRLLMAVANNTDGAHDSLAFDVSRFNLSLEEVKLMHYSHHHLYSHSYLRTTPFLPTLHSIPTYIPCHSYLHSTPLLPTCSYDI